MNKRAQRFLEQLQERVFVCDGAMGTMLYSKGIPITSCFEEMNLSMPSLVKEVHEAYRKAAAKARSSSMLRSISSRWSK